MHKFYPLRESYGLPCVNTTIKFKSHIIPVSQKEVIHTYKRIRSFLLRSHGDINYYVRQIELVSPSYVAHEFGYSGRYVPSRKAIKLFSVRKDRKDCNASKDYYLNIVLVEEIVHALLGGGHDIRLRSLVRKIKYWLETGKIVKDKELKRIVEQNDLSEALRIALMLYF